MPQSPPSVSPPLSLLPRISPFPSLLYRRHLPSPPHCRLIGQQGGPRERMRLRQALGGRIRHCHASGAARERGRRRLYASAAQERGRRGADPMPPTPSPPVVAAKKRDGGFAQATTVLGRMGVLGRGGSSVDRPREGGSDAAMPRERRGE
ncbi:Os04g0333400 [Oryza sativa Japonica Group]|uniref:Os04g0333400 protein n=1 Tax=Oryza sativa subsp. japonica TaxID=39947 RepID=A0A0P0W8P7_ORYSJ|nr:Os04g0333400 [Oryza sativa Japonica Group]